MGKESVENKLFEEVNLICDRLKDDFKVLAVLVTGPFALNDFSSDNKLYFAVITDEDEAVIEHHFLEEYAGIKKTMEVGIFPKKVVEHMLNKGYTDMPSYKALEAFRCGKVLYEKDNIGSTTIESSKKWIQKKIFVGDVVHTTKANIDDARGLLENKEYKNAVLVARAAVDEAFKLFSLATGNNTIPDKQYNLYKKVQGIESCDKEKADEIVNLAIEFTKTVLAKIGVRPEFISGE